MNQQQPQPEYLESGAGTPVPRERRSRKPLLLAGAGVAGVALMGGVAAGAFWWLSDGPQAAEALPASALGYVGLTLDPSGSQKVEALTTLRKFPAIAEELDLDGSVGDIDVKQALATAFLETAPCGGLTYAEHLEPWLGDRLGVAAVPVEGEVQPVVAIEVTDEGEAEDGLTTLTACGAAEGTEASGFFEVRDGWVLLAPDSTILDVAAADADEALLSDDEDFQRWTGEAGDPGVLTLYAAPEAAAYLSDSLDGLLDDLGAPVGGSIGMSGSEGSPSPEDQLREVLDDFEGAAAQVRFADGSVEVEMVGGLPGGDRLAGGGDAAALVSSLPDDTVLAGGTALGSELAAEWQRQTEGLTGGMLGGLFGEVEIDLPALLGDAVALAVGPGIDLDSFFSSTAPELPVAFLTTGQRSAADDAVTGPAGLGIGALLGTEPSVAGEDGRVVVGLSEAWSDAVAGEGSLGESDSFQGALPEADGADSLLFVDFDAVLAVLESSLPGLATEDDEVVANLEPLTALGVASQLDDDTARLLLRLTTD